MKIRITQDDRQKRIVGEFVDEIFYTNRKRSKHFMRKLQAWGIDAKVFDELKERGLKRVVLKDVESNKKVKAEVQDFEKYGKFLHFKPYRAQIFLNEDYWKEVD